MDKKEWNLLKLIFRGNARWQITTRSYYAERKEHARGSDYRTSTNTRSVISTVGGPSRADMKVHPTFTRKKAGIDVRAGDAENAGSPGRFAISLRTFARSQKSTKERDPRQGRGRVFVLVPKIVSPIDSVR